MNNTTAIKFLESASVNLTPEAFKLMSQFMEAMPDFTEVVKISKDRIRTKARNCILRKIRHQKTVMRNSSLQSDAAMRGANANRDGQQRLQMLLDKSYAAQRRHETRAAYLNTCYHNADAELVKLNSQLAKFDEETSGN